MASSSWSRALALRIPRVSPEMRPMLASAGTALLAGWILGRLFARGETAADQKEGSDDRTVKIEEKVAVASSDAEGNTPRSEPTLQRGHSFVRCGHRSSISIALRTLPPRP